MLLASHRYVTYAKQFEKRCSVVTVLPSEIPREAAREFVRKEKIGHPVLHAATPPGDPIAGWPVEALKWFVLLDTEGRMVAHGSSPELYERIFK